jgi:thiamine biosynthesis lipoprotein
MRIGDDAVATSSTMRRRWQTQNGTSHHLIDPRSGAPAETDLASVTAVGAGVAAAEVEAKSLLLLGTHAALQRCDRLGTAAVLIDTAGRVTFTRAMERCLV